MKVNNACDVLANGVGWQLVHRENCMSTLVDVVNGKLNICVMAGNMDYVWDTNKKLVHTAVN